MGIHILNIFFAARCRIKFKLKLGIHLNIGTSEVVGHKFECRLLSGELLIQELGLRTPNEGINQ